MIVRQRSDEDRTTWLISPGEAEAGRVGPDGARLGRRSVSFGIDPAVVGRAHPDLIALAMLLAFRPFVDEELALPVAVSKRMADVVLDALGIRLKSVSSSLAPRGSGTGRIGLCYSGGVDSTAALLCLPEDTVCVFMDRRMFDGGEPSGLYRSEAALHSLREVDRRGWSTAALPTDLEYVRQPVGFPVFDKSGVESSGIGPLLLADELGLSGVAWGTIAEAAYRTGFGAFLDDRSNAEHVAWRSVFAAVGLPVCSPLHGVSEVAATRIVQASELRDIAESCIRGSIGRPCRSCFKCARSTLMTAAVTGSWPPLEEVERLLLVREVRASLRESPPRLGNVLQYVLERFPGDSLLVDLVRRRIHVEGARLEHLERAFAPASQVIASDRREQIAQRLAERVEMMDAPHEAAFTSWDAFGAELEPCRTQLAVAVAAYLDARADDTGGTTGIHCRLWPYSHATMLLEQKQAHRAQRLQRLASEAELASVLESAAYRRGNALMRTLRTASLNMSRRFG